MPCWLHVKWWRIGRWWRPCPGHFARFMLSSVEQLQVWAAREGKIEAARKGLEQWGALWGQIHWILIRCCHIRYASPRSAFGAQPAVKKHSCSANYSYIFSPKRSLLVSAYCTLHYFLHLLFICILSHGLDVNSPSGFNTEMRLWFVWSVTGSLCVCVCVLWVLLFPPTLTTEVPLLYLD